MRAPEAAEPGGPTKRAPRVYEGARSLGRLKDRLRRNASPLVRRYPKERPWPALGYRLPTLSVPYQNDFHCVVLCTALVLRPRSGGFIVIIDPPSWSPS